MNANVFRRFPLFGGMEDDDLEAVARLVDNEEHSAGVLLTKEGAAASKLFLLEAGEVEIAVQDGEGVHAKAVFVVPGGLFGYSALVPPYRYDHTTRTVTPVIVLTIDAVRLRTLVEQDPRIGIPIHRNMIGLLHRSMTELRTEAWT